MKWSVEIRKCLEAPQIIEPCRRIVKYHQLSRWVFIILDFGGIIILGEKEDMSVIYDFKENIKNDELEIIKEKIKNGGLVVFPTETVYGIGADATNGQAVKNIFKAKGRPQDNPLIVHISNHEMLKEFTYDITQTEKALMDAFWPGPFTIILKSNKKLPIDVTAGLDTVGVRMPDNDIALSIIEKCNTPIAAPSANVSGRPSGTNIADIFQELNNKVDIFVDGGNTNIGIESTVVKVDNNVVNILRPGRISLEDIKALGFEAKLDRHVFEDVKDGEKVESPGMKHRHYAPAVKTLLLEYTEDESIMLDVLKKYIAKNSDKKIGILCFTEHKQFLKEYNTIDIGSINNKLEVSSRIYTKLRSIDKLDCDEWIIEGLSRAGIGTAIMNRLTRACSYNILK